MATNKRELIVETKPGSQGYMCSCKGCNWKASVKATDEEAQKAFESHRCEE